MVTYAIQAATNQVRTACITANTPTATTFQVIVTAGVTILGISVLGPGVMEVGATVYPYAVAPYCRS